jgi:hypothetical protein
MAGPVAYIGMVERLSWKARKKGTSERTGTWAKDNMKVDLGGMGWVL